MEGLTVPGIERHEHLFEVRTRTYTSLVPRPPYHGIPIRGTGTNFLRLPLTRKMVPIPRRASSVLVVDFIHVNRKEEEEDKTTVYQRL